MVPLLVECLEDSVPVAARLVAIIDEWATLKMSGRSAGNVATVFPEFLLWPLLDLHVVVHLITWGLPRPSLSSLPWACMLVLLVVLTMNEHHRHLFCRPYNHCY